MKTILGGILALLACACAAQAQDGAHPGFFADSLAFSRTPASSSLALEPVPGQTSRSPENRIESGAFQLGAGLVFHF